MEVSGLLTYLALPTPKPSIEALYEPMSFLEVDHRRCISMAMINCSESECNNRVSDQAVACPKCGCPVRTSEVDGLRFEYEKRQRRIQILYAELADRNHVQDSIDETMRRWPDNDDIRTSSLENQRIVMDRIFEIFSSIADAEREMAEIQKALDAKSR